jgi:hypothetical protein
LKPVKTDILGKPVSTEIFLLVKGLIFSNIRLVVSFSEIYILMIFTELSAKSCRNKEKKGDVNTPPVKMLNG